MTHRPPEISLGQLDLPADQIGEQSAHILDQVDEARERVAINLEALGDPAEMAVDEASLALDYLYGLYAVAERVTELERSVLFQASRDNEKLDEVKKLNKIRRRLAIELFRESLPEATRHVPSAPRRPRDEEWGEFYGRTLPLLGQWKFVRESEVALAVTRQRLVDRLPKP